MPFPNDLPVYFVPKIGEWSSSGDRHYYTQRFKKKRYHSLTSCSTKEQEESDILNLRMILTKPTCWGAPRTVNITQYIYFRCEDARIVYSN
jgi:hypothetical protein